MALVVMSMVEQRLDAARAVLAGARVTEVAAGLGVSRQSVHTWVARYLLEGVAGLADRSHRPASCPHQASGSVEARVVEMRREHKRWGAKRIRLELLRKPVEGVTVPSTATINRILRRKGLVTPRPRKKPRSAYVRFERPGPMQLWGIDIVGGIQLVDVATGVVREAKLITGVDDHSRFCVIASVVERATGRAVCLAFAQALSRFGVPEEVITDNGKQFTDRFGKGGEVLFDKICRRNGITHRLTAPASPNQNGKVERFHGTFRPDFLEDAGPFTSVEEAQAAVDAWVKEYNTDRPHQGLDENVPVTPADRFAPVPAELRAVLPLWLPPALEAVTVTAVPEVPNEDACGADASTAPATTVVPDGAGLRRQPGDAVQLERTVGPSGNLSVRGQQFWLGPARVGQLVRFWIDCDFIHLSIGGTRVKTVRSHLSVNDLAHLVAHGATPAGPPPLPSSLEPDSVVEVERAVAPRRHRRPGRSRDPGRGDPRRTAGRDPDRGSDADVLRPGHPRAAAHEAEPDPGREDAVPARGPPSRATAKAADRADHRATPRLEHRRHHGRRAESRPRPGPCPPDRDRPRRRDHPRDRGRRRDPRRTPDHGPARA